MNDSTTARASRSLLLAVALISAATLAVEVLQTRLFSVMLWHHLTYMVVTITLLGFAAGGSLLAVFPGFGRAHGDPRVAVSFCCSLFSLTLIAAFAVLSHSQLDTLDIDQDRAQYFWLFAQYAYLLVPFVFAGLAIAIALNEFSQGVHRTYFWNLIGSGVGSFLFVLLVRPLGGPGCLFWFASLAGLAGFVALWGERSVSMWPARLLALLALLPGPIASLAPNVVDTVVPIRAAPSKAQPLFEQFFTAAARFYHQQDPGYPILEQLAHLRQTRWTPTCRLDTLPVPPTPAAVKRDREQSQDAPRSQVHVFQDGDAPTVIWSGGYAKENDYDKHFYGLGYRLVEQPRVLVIGPGGGNDVETALHYGATEVTAVDINGDTLALVRNEFGDYTDHVYERPKVQWVHSEGRSHLRRAGRQYDLIQMSGTDTYAALSSGSYIFSESYLYTEEAFDDFFAHLSDNGVISIIRFTFEPPRETLKLVATGARALQRLGIQDVSRHFIVVNQVDAQAKALAESLEKNAADPQLRDLVRDFKRYHNEPLRYAFTITSKRAFTAADVATIEAALTAMNTPVVQHSVYYAAGTREQASNEYARLLTAMQSGPPAEQAFHREYPYRVAPASDDRPFFFNFHSWGDVLRLREAEDTGYTALTGSEPIGLYVLAALLLQTLLATVVLVILPLFRLGFGKRGRVVQSRGRVMLYFMALGLAYLLVEISTIQRFVLYLGHPTYSLTAGLAVFLVCSGLGSATAGALRAGPRIAAGACVLVVVLLIVQALILPDLLRDTLAYTENMRLLVTIACIGPVAFAMGVPFPSGLKVLRDDAPGMIPWAFGVNGAASVLASILSIMLAMEAGFRAVALLAALLYLLAALTVPRRLPALAAEPEPEADVLDLPPELDPLDLRV